MRRWRGHGGVSPTSFGDLPANSVFGKHAPVQGARRGAVYLRIAYCADACLQGAREWIFYRDFGFRGFAGCYATDAVVSIPHQDGVSSGAILSWPDDLQRTGGAAPYPCYGAKVP